MNKVICHLPFMLLPGYATVIAEETPFYKDSSKPVEQRAVSSAFQRPAL
jgi:hypothetical protein